MLYAAALPGQLRRASCAHPSYPLVQQAAAGQVRAQVLPDRDWIFGAVDAPEGMDIQDVGVRGRHIGPRNPLRRSGVVSRVLELHLQRVRAISDSLAGYPPCRSLGSPKGYQKRQGHGPLLENHGHQVQGQR